MNTKNETAEQDNLKQIAEQTGDVLQSHTNWVLDFLGVPIDVNYLLALTIDWSGKLILALMIFFVGKWIGKRIIRVALRVMQRSHIDKTAASFLGNLLYGLMLVAVTLAALNKLGVNTNSFVAILGGAAVAIGVSLKDQLGNLAAGVMIVLFRPFNRGDYVEVGGQLGTVMDITLVNTRIRTNNNHEITIPNGDIMTSATTNFSSLPKRRVEVAIGISYDSDIDTARHIMLAEAEKHPKALTSPAPIVRVTDLGDNAVTLTMYVWSENEEWFFLQCDLLETIKKSFDAGGVGLPFPQRTIHIADLERLGDVFKQPTKPNKVTDGT